MINLEDNVKNVKDFKNSNAVNVHYFDIEDENPNTNSRIVAMEMPRYCPHCKQTGIQHHVDTILITGYKSQYAAVGVFSCYDCKESTISLFNFEKLCYENKSGSNEIGHILTLSDSIPKIIEDITVSETIQNMFPNFYEIYTQAISAEKYNLNHLAGMGYRKSIEFLVTEFLKKYPTDDTVTVEWLENPYTTLLNKVKKLPNARLVKIGTAITYLGNDGTHYTIRHPNYGIEDMKIFIDLLLKEIDSEIIYQGVEDFLG